MSAFNVSIRDQVARLTFDLPDEKVNKLTAAALDELDGLIAGLERRSDLQAVVIASAKPGVFIAGADITEIQNIRDVADARTKARRGQEVFERLARLPQPTIAVIDGACLGGGLELALACDWRVVTDAEKTRLGLPEVTLGIIPGWGGTQRLPRLVGLPAALDLILSGRQVPGLKAFKMGLADACIAHAFLADELPRFIAAVVAGRRRAPLPRLVRLAAAPGLRHVVLSRARAAVMRRTHGLMPAPLGALEVLRRSAGTALDHGLLIEAEVFSRLAVTPACRNLVDAFFASEDARKAGTVREAGPSREAGPGSETGSSRADAVTETFPARESFTVPAEVRTAGVLGAGIMGGGIAWAFSAAGIPVRMRDLAWPAVAKGLAQAAANNDALIKLRKLTPGEHSLRMHRISGTLDLTGFAACDLVVEAVVEDLAVKRRVLADAEAVLRDDCVLATNTSSLAVADLASALCRPQRLVGMHFFNPVNRMPLVEVIAGPDSAPEAVRLAAATARRLGKTVVVVRDCPGFLVNRILLPYLNEAARAVEDGAGIAQVDAVISRFGMPMGPFTLTDEVGIDVGYKVARILNRGYGERHAVAELLKVVHEDLHLTGTKGGKGFFVHHGRHLAPNPEVAEAVRTAQHTLHRSPHPVSDQEILDRCLLTMVNEAARCVDEGVVAKAAQLDLAMLMGTGFPAARGGPLHYADSLGLERVVDRLKDLEQRCGPRFAPAPLLTRMAQEHRTFT